MERSQLPQAIATVKQRLEQFPQFKDLANFKVMAYTSEELDALNCKDDNKKWKVRYSKGSALGDDGIILIANISKLGADEAPDYLAYGLGEALWELIHHSSRMMWEAKSIWTTNGKATWAFAVDLVFLLRGDELIMSDGPLFRKLTAA